MGRGGRVAETRCAETRRAANAEHGEVFVSVGTEERSRVGVVIVDEDAERASGCDDVVIGDHHRPTRRLDVHDDA